MKTHVVLLAVCHLSVVFAASYDYEQDSGEDDGGNSCLPQIADQCFKDVYENLLCHMNPSTLPDCIKKDVNDFCKAASDALDCAVNVVDGDCTIYEGTEVFDSWMNGLQYVHKAFCAEERELLKVLIATPDCWDSLLFLRCVEKTIKVNSTIGLMKLKLDLPMCNQIAVATSACNVKATRQRAYCEAPQGAVSEAIHSFFTGTNCGIACNTNFSTKHMPSFIVFISSLAYNLYVITNLLFQRVWEI